MENQNNIRKCLEVVWNRKSSINKSKYMLPKMKEINIDDSCKKKKKSSKSQYCLQDSKNNENSKEHAHKLVKRSLFQENKNKCLRQNKLKKTHDCIQNLKKSSDNVFEASQIPCTKPQIITKRDKLKRKEGVPNDCVTTLRKNIDCLSGVPQISCTKSPQIISIREKLKRKGELNDCVTNLRQNLDNLPEVCQVPCTKSQIISNRDNLKRKSEEPSDYVTSLRKNIDCLSDVPQISCTKSPPQISCTKSPQKKILTAYLIQNLDNLSEVCPVPCTKSQVISNRDNLKRKAEEAPDYVTSLRQSSDRLSEVSQISYPIFPLIRSTHEKLFRQGHNLVSKNVDKLNTPNSNEIKMDKNIHKRVKKSLFQKNKDKHYSLSKLNKGYSTPYDNITNLRKTSDCLSEVSQVSSTKSPEIIPNRESLKRNNVDDCIININKSVNDLPEVSQISYPKSSQIISYKEKLMEKQIKYIELNNLDKLIAPNNYDKIYMDFKFTQKLNEKSENKNFNLNKEQSKLNSVDLGNIIESSEVIYPFNKQKSKKNQLNGSKKSNIKDHIIGSHVDKSNISSEGNTENKLQNNELKKYTEIPKSNCSEICSTIHVNCLDITLNKFKLESSKLKLKKNSIEFKEDQNGSITKMFKMDDNVISPFLNSKELVTKTIKENEKTFKPNRTVHFSLSKDKNTSFTSPSEVSIIPATPEHDVLNAEKPIVEYSPETHVSKYVPLIEVDQSPKTPQKNNCHALIQSDQSSSNMNTTLLPGIFETATSPPQSFRNSKLPFNIDSVETPSITFENENCVSSEMCRKKFVDSPSPNHFDSAKKRKKCCKNGLRGKFQELINRKKSEACIREYEKNLFKNHHSKQGESAILNVVEAWKEFGTYILFCYYIKSEMEIQKVLVILNNCPKNATKNSIIRIRSPWLTIESKTTETVLFVGIIHAEVIEHSVSIKSLGPTGLFTSNINGLQTTIFQSDILWKCNCSKDTACQCLGELSVYNYLQYMISH
ncbi:Hypothetical protein CINCED_3A023058 [Cinara cedri]|uniref:Uncharacterized protein n=1 Tax=Cinara cedri TaxID=506608 RepID=A0A5E4N978_9HEMI|nr:Hypothetical protein CINCED_3A023058 [Cinara cedri]